MSTTAPRPGLEALPAAARPYLAELTAGLEKAAGDNLVSLVVYGSAVRGGYEEGVSDLDVIVVLRDTALPRLLACSEPLLLARHRGRVEAMILKPDDIESAADVFPLFYEDVKSRHLLLAGRDLFQGVAISDDHCRLRIEQELREAKIRMRRAAVDAQGSDAALAGALIRKVKQLRGPLHALLRLRGTSCDDTLSAVYGETGKAYGIDTAPLLRVLDDPAAAHAAFRQLLEAAVHEADRLNTGSPS
jgi:predicted nucleotidyltransferase